VTKAANKKSAKQKPAKRDAILQAMLEIVSERGFHDAPMSLLAKQSGASAGVIYHYFASKDEIIQALFVHVCELKRVQLMAGYSAEMEAREGFLLMAQNTYHFYRKNPKALRFLQQYKSAGFTMPKDIALSLQAEAREMQKRYGGRAVGGVLEDLPPDVIEELTLGTIERLARLPHKISDKMLHQLAEGMWELVRAK
jgi:AcrR family transcriptional regulator